MVHVSAPGTLTAFRGRDTNAWANQHGPRPPRPSTLQSPDLDSVFMATCTIAASRSPTPMPPVHNGTVRTNLGGGMTVQQVVEALQSSILATGQPLTWSSRFARIVRSTTQSAATGIPSGAKGTHPDPTLPAWCATSALIAP